MSAEPVKVPRAAAARRLAGAAHERGDHIGWFEELYAAAGRGEMVVPWAEHTPNPHLVSWAERVRPAGRGRALVVGCGLGDDAEFLAGLGFRVTAFDIAPTAVAGAVDRFPGSPVDYTVADVLDPPADWRGAFDLVLEAYTVQVHRGAHRTAAIANIAACTAPGGTLLVVAHARLTDDPGQMPWPLSRAEVESFARADLVLRAVEELFDDAPPGPRWRAEFRRLNGVHQ